MAVQVRGREADVSVEQVERVERRPMSLEEFLALPEGTRAEYSDGVAIMTPPAGLPHNEVAARLFILLRSSLRGVLVGYEMGVVLGPRRRQQPDIAVVDRMEETRYTEQVPHLVVEVLSPSTRSEDLVRKSHEYAVAGIAQYWVVDREAGTLTVFTNTGDGWDVLLRLDDTEPRGEVQVGELGAVPLDVEELFTL